MKLLKTIAVSALSLLSLNAFALKDYTVNIPFGFFTIPVYQQISGTQPANDHHGYTIDCTIAHGDGSTQALKYRVESVNFIPQNTDTPDGTYLLYTNQAHHFYKNYSQPIDPSQPSTLRITNVTNIYPAIILVSCKNIPPVKKVSYE